MQICGFASTQRLRYKFTTTTTEIQVKLTKVELFGVDYIWLIKINVDCNDEINFNYIIEEKRNGRRLRNDVASKKLFDIVFDIVRTLAYA